MRGKLVLASVALMLISWAPSAAAQVELVSEATGISGSPIDWTFLGFAGTNVAQGATVEFGGGQAASVFGGDLKRREQGMDWFGDFLPGTQLLRSLGGPITLVFRDAIQGFGARVQSGGFFGSPFVATLRAYGAGDVFLGSIQATGSVGFAADGSAPFLGLTSTAGIARVELSTDADFIAMDGGVVGPHAPSSVVPEPVSMLLLGTGLGGVALARRRRREIDAQG